MSSDLQFLKWNLFILLAPPVILQCGQVIFFCLYPHHLKNDKDVAKRDETFMLLQKGKMLELLDSIDDKELVKECFHYLMSKRDE